MTIHIFSYGETQIISETVNLKTSVDKLTKVQAVIDDIKSKKPSNKTANDYHAINIFADLRADYIAKADGDEDKSSFSVPFKDLDVEKINALVLEFDGLANA